MLPPTPLPNLDAAMNRLARSLSELTTSHANNTVSMTNLADERNALEDKEKEMRTLVEEAETKRSWFNAFKEWVETIATFLDEKVGLFMIIVTRSTSDSGGSILSLKNLKMNTSHY